MGKIKLSGFERGKTVFFREREREKCQKKNKLMASESKQKAMNESTACREGDLCKG
jgi:ribosomal protein S17